ncbi:hypothetical protein AURDEDRAFT_173019 [Auricularia subglabra TFB-10046 SS5]|uniref:Uncharacterized protein n=1 Tax=Auricularia subglabra (strain TFB-10046 / SS5) TaxID=717982 RepID=J0WUY7_AURST|nr:hypothetical protein AURDEDRAFT_173019 [Auricularia subglabra TFB-10046 SS5]
MGLASAAATAAMHYPVTAAVVGGTVAAPLVVPAALGALGFGSIAAGVQAGIGNVAAGSLFAAAQSAAAAGISWSTSAVVGVGAGTAVAAAKAAVGL